jgi:hypothetical protein
MREQVLKHLQTVAKQWRDPVMQSHLDGARTFAVGLLIDLPSGVNMTEAESLVDSAIAGEVCLLPFCDDEEGRKYQLHLPVVRNGFEYATDGRIAVRRPTEKSNSQNRIYPKIEEIFQGIPRESDFIPIPPQEFDGKCGDDCLNGTSYCTECENDSECYRCAGTGSEQVWIDRLAVSPRYDRLIRTLPDLHVCCDAIKQGVWFRSGNMVGLLLGLMTEPGSKQIRWRETAAS